MNAREGYSLNRYDICCQMDRNRKTCKTRQWMLIAAFVSNYVNLKYCY
jgi:hypothetical protein